MRVLHVLGPIRPSGMERMLVSAAPYFKAENIESFVLGRRGHPDFTPELESAGYNVTCVSGPMRQRASRKTLHNIISANKVDIVHIHTEADYLLTVVTSHFARRDTSIVRTVHSVFEAHGWWLVKRRIQATIGDRFVGEIIACSEAVADNERRIGRSSDVIYNWVADFVYKIQQERQRGEPRVASTVREPVGLIVGNCAEVKRHELALSAVKAAGHSVSHIGSEDHASVTELALLDAMEIEGKVQQRHSGDPSEALRKADYYLMPSLREGFPVALAEALVAGLPAVVSEAGGMDWARSVTGVFTAEPTIDDWTDKIQLAVACGGSDCRLDLSAQRGAMEYARAYRGAMSKTNNR